MDAPTPITPAGWYDDGHGRLRWWDGQRWTEHTAPLSRPAAPTQAARPQAPEPRVKAPLGKLVWILPIVLVVAALVGGLLGALSAATFGNSDALDDTYTRFVAAERTGDCRALEEVTTASFRDDLMEPLDIPYSCTAWRARLLPRAGDAKWSMRLGPVGVLVAEERRVDARSRSSSLVTYTLISEDGRWKLDDVDDSDTPD